MVLLWVLVLLAGCQAPEAPGAVARDGGLRAPDVATPRRSGVVAEYPDDRLAALYHQQWIRGDLRRARRGLSAIIASLDLPAQARARAALRLAEISENSGARRRALALLGQVSTIVGTNSPLARRAMDLRDRIRSAAPLAAVRGPIPGSVSLAGETPQVNAAFRRAEARLARFHRVVVAPRLENIDAVLRKKRHALRRAVKSYRALIERGRGVARAAANFRIGAMYHHFAEAVAFDRPPELTEAAAERLARRLRAKSVGHLRRALDHYRRALATRSGPGLNRWRRLARAESRKLARELAAPRR